MIRAEDARVLMTTDAIGGVWTYACELARSLRPRGVGVSLAVMGGGPDERRRAMAERVPGLELFESDFRLEWMEDPWDDLEQAGVWLRSLARRVEPDVVHVNGYYHAALGWDVPVVVVGHSCVLSWWAAVRDDSPPPRLERYRDVVRSGLDAADAVVAPTEAHLRAMERQYGAIDGRVIPNGRRPDEYRPGRKLRLALVVGRLWDRAKNVGAVARLAPDLPWPVYAAGARRSPDGEASDADAPLSAAAARRGAESAADGDGAPPAAPEREGGPAVPTTSAEPGFHPLGEVGPHRLADWYGAASVFVLPARYEPFGLAPLEAGLAGCALVLGDIGTLREVWGSAAAFVPPDDRTALRRTLRRLMEDGARRQEMAARARRRALELGADAMGRRYRELYRELGVGSDRATPGGSGDPGAGDLGAPPSRTGRAGETPSGGRSGGRPG